jgi:serine/threonine-protein kinase HipA
MVGESLTLERWTLAGWKTLATVRILKPGQGLLSPMRLDYDTEIAAVAQCIAPDPGEDDDDEQAPVIRLPFVHRASSCLSGDVFRTCEGEPVAALLRDLIPSGWARRRILETLAPQRRDGPHNDLALLQRATRSPIGDLRIKGAFCEPADAFPPAALDIEARGYWNWPYVSKAVVSKGHGERPLWAGLGAGGESPKLLVNRCVDGGYYLDGNEPADTPVTDYWLVKWPRGPVSQNRRDILRAEYLYLQALRDLGFDVPEVRWRESALWIRRFDRGSKGERAPVESLYNVMGSIGDGARLSHTRVLDTILPLASDRDEMLSEYLIRDHINRLLGNCDNHGRNTAFHRAADGLHLTPLYDVAPMVMDEDGIAWSTTWPTDWLREGRPDWHSLVQRYAEEPDRVLAGLQSRCVALTEL